MPERICPRERRREARKTRRKKLPLLPRKPSLLPRSK